ncbi:ABC transporter ATP-binding protein [Modestobacter versicolor]|uniref:Branched-chain amino acid transport system ATP-binding protein n=1 Tax=Modestobacter versicolor TaxID=429133 RepID=A0A839XT93_9ACTN|nr:ABC transporter ATP-binding protein [Modestobacter versicolor]MBB3674820.1 branched-chain amino acid transport system ATP-binding protein [Modestobacter versicolor]
MIRDLTVRYGRAITVLRSVDLEVAAGTVVALMGVNGAGKTTLARAVTGMLPFHSGTVVGGDITWRGRSLLGRKPGQVVRAGVSQTLEGRRIFAELTVDQNLAVGGMSRRNDQALKDSRTRVLDLFPKLRERLDQRAGYLSGGEQQMLALGRALMQSPELLVLDEPSLGLAPIIVDQIRETIGTIRDAGTSVLLIEQNAMMALAVSDHGYILSHGAVTKHGPSSELLADPDIQSFYLGLDEAADEHAPAGNGAPA